MLIARGPFHSVFCFVLAVALLAFGLPAQAHAGGIRTDGNFWIQIEDNSGEWAGVIKLSFVRGFFDGIELGSWFSTWSPELSVAESPPLEEARARYMSYRAKYVAGIAPAQVVDGLDDFYADYRNRSMSVPSAIWLVLNSIAGTPDDQLQTMIEGFRRFAREEMGADRRETR
jgi:hypothetical protein